MERHGVRWSPNQPLRQSAKNEAWSFAHFDPMTLMVSDAHGPAEIVLCMAVSNGTIPKPRAGEVPIACQSNHRDGMVVRFWLPDLMLGRSSALRLIFTPPCFQVAEVCNVPGRTPDQPGMQLVK